MRFGYREEISIGVPDTLEGDLTTLFPDEMERAEVLGALLYEIKDKWQNAAPFRDWMYLRECTETWTAGWYEITSGYPNDFGRFTLGDLQLDLQTKGTYVLLIVTDVTVDHVDDEWWGKD
jgi:hypothetical protein